MRPVRVVVWGCALAVLAAAAQPGRAAWCNVFQVCCNSCGSASAAYAPPADPCCAPCPPPQRVCTTHYEQRCYYQPVTTYQSRTYYEPVTTYRTSYYYEPVTTYRYSSYYDPCSCTCQQVACPVTCYQLRSQCCPVQSWVQRCCSVPVTTYQQCSYWEPVTTCCEVPCNPCAAPAPACPPAAPAVAPAAPAAPAAPVTPGVIEQHNATVPPVAPGVNESREGGVSNKPYNNYIAPQPMPPASYNHQVAPAAPRQTAPPPVVRLDRIVLAPSPRVEGQVVGGDRAPRAGAEVLFVSAERRGSQHTATADGRGQFHVALATGGAWLVYVRGGDGKLVPQGQIRVKDEETRRMTLVSR